MQKFAFCMSPTLLLQFVIQNICIFRRKIEATHVCVASFCLLVLKCPPLQKKLSTFKEEKNCPLLQRNRRLIFILVFYIYVVFSLSFYVLYMSTCIQVEKTKHGNLISSVPFDNQSKLSSSAAN